MASIEVMKKRARIAGRFNLSARRNPEHRALVALAAQRAGGECHVIPAAPGEDEADVLDRARKVAGGKPVIIVTEADGEPHIRLVNIFDLEFCKNLKGPDERVLRSSSDPLVYLSIINSAIKDI